VKKSGEPDKESLTVQGWQRAGALAHFFASEADLRPDVIFSSGIGAGSESHRPKQTVMPLAKLLGIEINEKHLRDEVEPLMSDVEGCQGIVLVSWEHHRIPGLVALLKNAPAVPAKWPDDRFDIVWILHQNGNGWDFTQKPQLLLAADLDDEIPFKSHKKE
jgi:hypothetical protein